MHTRYYSAKRAQTIAALGISKHRLHHVGFENLQISWLELKFTDFENINSLPALIFIYLSEFMPALLFVSL